MVSCGTPKAVTVTEKTTEVITETIHDTIFKTERDSSMYQALLECQNGKVVVKEVTKATAGNHLTAPKVNVKDNVLTVDCEAEAQKLFAQWKSEQRVKSTLKEVPVYVDIPLNKFDSFCLNLGRIALVLIIVLLGWGIYKLFKK